MTKVAEPPGSEPPGFKLLPLASWPCKFASCYKNEWKIHDLANVFFERALRVTTAHCAAETCACVLCSPSAASGSSGPSLDTNPFWLSPKGPSHVSWVLLGSCLCTPRRLVLKQSMKELRCGGIYYARRCWVSCLCEAQFRCALLQSALGNKQRGIPGSTELRAWAEQPPQKHELPGSGDTTSPGSFPRAICWMTWQAHPTPWEAHHV